MHGVWHIVVSHSRPRSSKSHLLDLNRREKTRRNLVQIHLIRDRQTLGFEYLNLVSWSLKGEMLRVCILRLPCQWCRKCISYICPVEVIVVHEKADGDVFSPFLPGDELGLQVHLKTEINLLI